MVLVTICRPLCAAEQNEERKIEINKRDVSLSFMAYHLFKKVRMSPLEKHWRKKELVVVYRYLVYSIVQICSIVTDLL